MQTTTSLRATWTFGVPLEKGRPTGSATGTIAGYAPPQLTTARAPIDLADTVDGSDALGVAATRLSNPMATQSRTTVLPRRTKSDDGEPSHVVEERPRFDRVRQLGEGAVGTVELARDNDIRRTVAVKKLRADVRSSSSLLRFADEVRIVGQLEHPSIVPVYDVGRDDVGDVYLVMKHLEGETMEDVIEKLRADDPAYVARFSPQFRAHLFLSVLDAMRYANARGILHRDLKPANIMIGPYDEVTIMDWGIAKPIGKRDSLTPPHEKARSWLDSADQRLLETQIGTLAGTPFYMSPEQAAGMNDSLDERSDVYALGVVFYEWLTLEHPLEGKSTLIEVLASVITQEHDERALLRRASRSGVACEYVYLAHRAMRRDRDERIQSASALYDELKAILEGRVRVQCAVTFTKRATQESLRLIDRHPAVFFTGLALTAVAVITGVGTAIATLVHAMT